MGREAFDQSCPLALLAEHGSFFCPCKAAHSPRSDIPCRRGLNKKLEKNFASAQSRTPSLRDSIFFNLYPTLLKILRRYCYPGPGCYQNCFVGDILSELYIAFAKYLDQIDASRCVGFLSYMIKKLSWRAFNSFAREHRVRMHEILCEEERDQGVAAIRNSISPENRLITLLDLEKYLSHMQSKTRNLCLLHYYEGYSYSELATMERRQEIAIRKAVSRACREIREADRFDQRHEVFEDK